MPPSCQAEPTMSSLPSSPYCCLSVLPRCPCPVVHRCSFPLLLPSFHCPSGFSLGIPSSASRALGWRYSVIHLPCILCLSNKDDCHYMLYHLSSLYVLWNQRHFCMPCSGSTREILGSNAGRISEMPTAQCLPAPQEHLCPAPLSKTRDLSFKNYVFSSVHSCFLLIVSVKFKSDSDDFSKYLFIKTKTNNEGISRWKHLPNNPRKLSGYYLRVHKYDSGMPSFILKLPLGKLPSDDSTSYLADFMLDCKCYLWSLVSNHHIFKTIIGLNLVTMSSGHSRRQPPPFSVLLFIFVHKMGS